MRFEQEDSDMQRFVTIGTAVLLALAVSVAAAPQNKAKHHATRVQTLTGCLEKGDEANTFKLTHVAEGAGAATKTAEAMKPDWELIGAPASLKLSEHVGHKVTVTGRRVGAGEAAKVEGEGGAAKAKEATERHLKVTGMKHVAATCP
jgi:hypothetical protein